jgi:AcrR family transcriptional regulator
LRADAERNRDRVLTAARAAFRELGADAPIVEIARRAGVGAATLYRRFPTRESLFVEVFADRLTSCSESIVAAARNPDPWQGLLDHLRHLFSLQREHRAFTAVFLHEFPNDSPISRSRHASGRALRQLMTAAKAAGQLREDVAEQDVLLALEANDGVLRWASDPAAESDRLFTTFVRALHTGSARASIAAGSSSRPPRATRR